MKRIVILIVVLVASVALFADEVQMIDFNKLVPDSPADKPIHNQATIVDFSREAGTVFTDAEKAAMRTSLAIENWEVNLNTSAQSVVTEGNSYIRAAKVKDDAVKYAKETILGIRGLFPEEPANAYLEVVPPFKMPVYSDKDTIGSDGKVTVAEADHGKGTKFDGYGVVKNIGVLKSISINVYGLNYPETLTIIMSDNTMKRHEFYMGNLQFEGWRTLTWENPNYITDVRNRDLAITRVYPEPAPYLRLEGFRIYKNASMPGGDFIGYIKDVSLVFDKANLETQRDIDNEALWQIHHVRDSALRDATLKGLGLQQVGRYIEQRKMDNPQDRAAPKTDAKTTTSTNSTPGGTSTPPANNTTPPPTK